MDKKIIIVGSEHEKEFINKHFEKINLPDGVVVNVTKAPDSLNDEFFGSKELSAELKSGIFRKSQSILKSIKEVKKTFTGPNKTAKKKKRK